MSQATKRSRLNKDNKERIIFLATQGLKYDEIARDIGCQLVQVSGYLRAAANFKLIPPELASAGSTKAAERAAEKTRQNRALAAGVAVPPSIVTQPPEQVYVPPVQVPLAPVQAPPTEVFTDQPAVEEGQNPQSSEISVGALDAPELGSAVPDLEFSKAEVEFEVPPVRATEVFEPVAPPVVEPTVVESVPQPVVESVAVPVQAAAPVPVPVQVAPPAPVIKQEEIKVPVSAPLPIPPVVKGPVYLPEKKMTLPAPGVPVQPQVAAAPPVAQAPGWSSAGRHVPGYLGGFENAAQSMRYQVKRLIPNDGIVGEHTGNFSESDLCNLYGEGSYRIFRFEPNRAIPIEHEVKVGSNFGPSRAPKFSVAGQPAAPENRFARPRVSEEDAPGYERPSYRERSLFEFARQQQQQAQASVGNDVTAEAIRQLGEANKRAQEQVESSRKNGPDAFVHDFFRSQNDLMYKRAEDEKKGAEQRRKDDEEKWERRQREVDQEHRRRQDEEEKRHTRDLERIRVESESRQKAAESERKLMMDLEDKKLALIREEAKLRQDILQQELQANREAMKELQESTETQVNAVKEAMQRELTKDREGLEREHKIREKSLDKEHELSSKILDIKQESLQKQGGDQIFNLLDTVVKEFGQGLKQIVDLNKLQSMTPEAQAASVAGKTMNGDSVEPRRQESAPAADARPGPEVTVEAAAPQEDDGGRQKMDTLMQTMVEQPVFKQVLREWSRQVKMGEDPTAFTGMFLDWLQDPSDFNVRKGCNMFVNFIKSRTWPEVLEVIAPKLDRDVLAAFKTEHAADFYEGFKAIVVEHVKMYFEEFLAGRKQAQEAKLAPPAPAAVAATEPIEAEAAPELSEEEAEAKAEAEAVPVPTRANLRPVK